ncbi:MAG TPA: hypothetical protein VLX29_06225, partial [Nitrospirota bacterium]|nr:hypothetical protein [Nitrospirota bacterium]
IRIKVRFHLHDRVHERRVDAVAVAGCIDALQVRARDVRGRDGALSCRRGDNWPWGWLGVRYGFPGFGHPPVLLRLCNAYVGEVYRAVLIGVLIDNSMGRMIREGNQHGGTGQECPYAHRELLFAVMLLLIKRKIA